MDFRDDENTIVDVHIQDFFPAVFTAWSEKNIFFQQPVEAFHENLTQKLSIEEDLFSFERFFHAEDVDGFSYQPIVLNDDTKQPLYFYLPNYWSTIKTHPYLAYVQEKDKIRQSIVFKLAEEEE